VRTQINKNWGGAALNEYYSKWQDLINDVNAESSASFQGVQTTSSYIRMEVEVAFLDGFINSVSYTIILCSVVMIFFTQNLYLVLLVCVYILTICVWVVGLFGALGWPFSIIEIISVPTVVGLTIDYALHITHAYIHSPFPDRVRRAKSAVNDLGSSVFASAMTTVSSMFVLYFATIVIFSDLGWVVGTTTIFGVLLALFVCPPCLMLTGPQYDQCHFTWLCPPHINGVTVCGHTFCSNSWHGKRVPMEKGVPQEHHKAIELEVQQKQFDGAMDGDEGTNPPTDDRAAAKPVEAEAEAGMVVAAVDMAPGTNHDLATPILADGDKSYEKIMAEQANLMKQIEQENEDKDEVPNYVPPAEEDAEQNIAIETSISLDYDPEQVGGNGGDVI